MKLLTRFAVLFLFTFNMLAANAELISFSYTFDANPRGVPGHVLTGIVDGTVLEDGDTIEINNFIMASLDGYRYVIGNFIGIRTANFGDVPVMSLSGDTLDFWVCTQGFTQVFLGGGDCPFGAEGGFLISDNLDLIGTGGGNARAGIPELGDVFRDFDSPINKSNWSAEIVTMARVSFSYTFDASIRGTPGHVLTGVVDGIVLSDNDTIEIIRFREVSLAGHDYLIDGKFIGIRASNRSDKAVMSLSGNALDFWVCTQGFTQILLDGSDCPFGAEGGFLVTHEVDFGSGAIAIAIAGIPELGDTFRDIDVPITLFNWDAEITKVIKPKKPKKPKKQK